MKSPEKYSICETVHAINWHIRRLSDKGRCLGGGADTKTLCGLRAAWDLRVEITQHHLENNICPRCAMEFTECNSS